MNERIEKLTIEASNQTGNEFDLNHKPLDDFLKKFAEMIIQECMEAVDGFTMARTFETYYDAVQQIEALFGVKYERED